LEYAHEYEKTAPKQTSWACAALSPQCRNMSRGEEIGWLAVGADRVAGSHGRNDRKASLMKSLVGRLGALTVGLGLAVSSSAVLAQTAPKPAPAAPAATPAAPVTPAAPAAAAPPATAQGGPVKLDLQPMQSPWTKICGKDQATSKEVCYTTRDFGQAADQPPTLAIAVYQMTNQEKRIARFLLPVALMLKPGFRMVIDKGEPIDGKFAICFPNGCFAEAELNSTTIGALKKSQTVSVQVHNQADQIVSFNLPMKDFGTAFDGPAVDPKVLEQQNQELQKQLEDKAKTAREQLEKAATPTPTPVK
jgi:invasion protein IalB